MKKQLINKNISHFKQNIESRAESQIRKSLKISLKTFLFDICFTRNRAVMGKGTNKASCIIYCLKWFKLCFSYLYICFLYLKYVFGKQNSIPHEIVFLQSFNSLVFQMYVLFCVFACLH